MADRFTSLHFTSQDRYWGFLSKCRMPMVPNMALPFNCPMDYLYLTDRWNDKKVKYREHTFLANPNVPKELLDNKVRLTVAAKGETPAPATASAVDVPYGTAMSDVRAAVLEGVMARWRSSAVTAGDSAAHESATAAAAAAGVAGGAGGGAGAALSRSVRSSNVTRHVAVRASHGETEAISLFTCSTMMSSAWRRRRQRAEERREEVRGERR